MKKTLLTILILLITLPIFSQRKYESYYQDKFATIINGQTEVILSDKTRVDIVTDTHVIEVDFAQKWAESIGQSLHYSYMTGLKPGILLVADIPNHTRFITRLTNLAFEYDITVWIMDYNTESTYLVKKKYDYELLDF